MTPTSEQSSSELSQNNGASSVLGPAPTDANPEATAVPSSLVGAAAPLNVTAAAATTTDATATTTIASSTTGPQEHDDKDFDPSAEALIDEMDDERTLEEEEAMAGDSSAAVQNELDDLKRESEMPIEELLAFYARMRNQEAQNEGDNDDEDEDFDDDEEDDEDEEQEPEQVAVDESDEVRRKRECSNVVIDSTNERLAPTLNQSEKQSQQPSPPQQTQVSQQLSDSQILTPPLPQPQLQQHNLIEPSMSNDTHAKIPVSISNQHHDHPGQTHFHLKKDFHYHLQPSLITSENVGAAEITQRQQPCGPSENRNDPNSYIPASRHKHSMTEFLVDSGANDHGMFRTLLDYDLDDSDELDEDYSYTDDEYSDDERGWRRVIHVGPEYQADVPEGLSKYESDLPPYENEDKLVWKCDQNQTQEEILDYLKIASMISKRDDISISPASVPKISDNNMRLYKERMQDNSSNPSFHPVIQNHEFKNFENPLENLYDAYMSQSRKRLRIDDELEQENAMDGMSQPCVEVQTIHSVNHARDDNSNSISQDTNRPELSTEDYFHSEEQLLYLLLQCNHNFEEALRRRRLDPFKYYLSEPMTLWSQDECLRFEHGLRIYGKNFHLIRENKVPTRSRSEVVSFYYLWKKSERHDVYTNQYKLDRKRCLNHPGTTDYMDKFIEDNESALNASSTPTPTPTDSTVDINQISDVHRVNQSLSICTTSSTRPMLPCPDKTDASNAAPNHKDMPDVGLVEDEGNNGQAQSTTLIEDQAPI